jgi:hypothetical protein
VTGSFAERKQTPAAFQAGLMEQLRIGFRMTATGIGQQHVNPQEGQLQTSIWWQKTSFRFS